MSKLSKEELNKLMYIIEMHHISSKPIQDLLDLYNKEKEKNKKAIEYINKNCSTNNCDYMEDGVGNSFKDILELLEERN